MTRNTTWQLASMVMALLSAGCSTTPSFTNVVGTSNVQPQASDLVTHIQCEFYKALHDPKMDSAARAKFNAGKYMVYATVTFEVTNSQGVTPSLSFISTTSVTPLETMTNMIGGELSGMQHRTMTASFTLDMSKPSIDAEAQCASSRESSLFGGIEGDLGIEEIVVAGIKSSPTIFASAPGAPKLFPNMIPTIGSTIDYLIVAGLNGGPLWSLVSFKGPNGTNGLVAIKAQWKDTLTFSMASAVGQANAAYNILSTEARNAVDDQNKQAAADAAANAVTRQLLQLGPFANAVTP
jgi:hypothetical protein